MSGANPNGRRLHVNATCWGSQAHPNLLAKEWICRRPAPGRIRGEAPPYPGRMPKLKQLPHTIGSESV